MCGIVGAVLNTDRKSVQTLDIQSAIGTIRHRGPDDVGIWNDTVVYLGHSRLSILDLSEHGHQPMSTIEDRHILAYNGEIYNYQDLIADFELTNLRSSGDSEVILRLMAEHGLKILPEFNGMFAFAFYDIDSQKLVLARDRAGIKPLYYYQNTEGFYFASEIKALTKLISEPLVLNEAALHEWCYYGVSLGERTLYKNVYKLLPGHTLVVDTTNLNVSKNRYWRPVFQPSKQRSRNQLISETKKHIETAVRRQLVSDVPVGIFLSGGIDSSAIAAFASKHYEGRISTYSVGFDFDQGNNELPVAKKFANSLNTNHHELHIKGADLPSVIEKMVYHHDQPFSDAANIPLYLLCESISAETKVVLQGDGGDELFGGYKRYATLSKMRRMKSLARLFQLSAFMMSKNRKYYARQRYSNALLAPDDAEVMALLLTVEDRAEKPTSIFSNEFRTRIEHFDPFDRYRECQKAHLNETLAQQMLMIDFEIILPDVFLEKVDKSTMAASVEVRVPFLDNDLVDFCHSLTIEQKLNNGEQKWLLKKALLGSVPESILYGPKKGFGVPYAGWLTQDLKEFFFDHLRTFSAKHPSVLDVNFIESTFQDHCNGLNNGGFLLWKVLNFMVWCNINNKIYC